ncbi:hypothetical protein DL765_003470 [Monosporascus sp. GIB2]|nr:hypothetical protein DL765_003470 [Monosporascus sp. GIB2]
MHNPLAAAALFAVPETSASSGSGNIYIQLRAPTSYQWIGLGQGSGMAGANMFLLYADGAGNVTVSPRAGTGHVPPRENPNTEIEVLAGSGVIRDGGGREMMVANFRCGNCNSWTGGQMGLADTATNWIMAWRSGPALNTADRDAAISRHDSVDLVQLDLTRATVGEDSNPYVGGDTNERGGGSKGPNGSGGSSDGVGAPSGGSGAVTPVGAAQGPGRIVTAHWVIMFIVWLVLFPLGSALMPLFGNWIFHATWQSVTFVLMWVGFALGRVALSRFGGAGTTHTNFGTVIVCLMVLQPIGGYMHHRHYLRHKRRGPISYAHIWYGRALMIMGVVNGGLGIRWATGGSARGSPLMIAYTVVAAGMAVIYLGAKGFGVARRRRRGAAADADANGAKGVRP